MGNNKTSSGYDTVCHNSMVHTCDMQDHVAESERRGGGRPATINPEAVAAKAMELFATRGYESVSMDEIASHCGIGRKSLYRYFPTKASLVWGGLDEAVSASRDIMTIRDDVSLSSPAEVLLAAALAAARQLPDREVTRTRLCLIDAHAELGDLAMSKLRVQRMAVSSYLVSVGVSEANADYLSAAYSAALFAGWVRWARGSETHPEDCLRGALSAVNLPTGI